jgi:hypothetical protein
MLKFLLEEHREIEILRTVEPDLPRPESLSISLAKSNDDYMSAARLLYDSYQRRKIAFKHESKLRVIPQVMTPTTAVVVARSGSKIICTATVVCMNPFDFPIAEILTPSERVLHLHSNEAKGRICEIASLAIDHKYLAPASGIFHLLVGYLHEYCVNQLGCKKIVIGAQPGVVDFYRTMFGFVPMTSPDPRIFHSAGNDPTVPLWVTRETFQEKIKANSKRISRLKPLEKMFLEDPKTDPCYQYSEVDHADSFAPKSVSLIEELFLKQTEIMKLADTVKRERVQELYPNDDDYKWVFQIDPRLSRRRVRRFAVNLPTTIAVRSLGSGTTTHTGQILDISETGAQIQLDTSQSALPSSGEVTLTIAISATVDTSVHGDVIRRDPDMRSYGIQITDCSSSFLEFVRQLSAENGVKVKIS